MPNSPPADPVIFQFDEFQLDCAEHRLLRDGIEQALEPKSYALLVALLRRAGHVLSRDELLDAVWGRRFVTPGVLTRAISRIRIALRDPAEAPRYIQTVHTLGYRFIGVLQAAPEADSSGDSNPPHVVEAKDSYAVALRYLWERTPDGLEQALRRFQECTHLDPGNARAHAKVAQCCLLLYEYGDWSADEAFAQARVAIARAQSLEPLLAEAYAAQGLLELELNHYALAASLLRLATDLDGTLLQPRIWLGAALGLDGRLRQGEQVLLAAAAHHPGNVVLLAALSMNLALQGRSDSAEQLLAGIRRVGPGYLELYWQTAWLRMQQGRLADAWATLREADEQAGPNAWTHRCRSKLALMCCLPAPTPPPGLDDTVVRCELHLQALWAGGHWQAAVDYLPTQPAPATERCLRAAWLGHSLACAGRPVEALVQYDAAFPQDPASGDSLMCVWDHGLGLGERANHASLLDRTNPQRQPIIDGLHAQLGRLRDGGMQLPSLAYHEAVLWALEGDDTAGKLALDRALESGFLDGLAFHRELAWRGSSDRIGLPSLARKMQEAVEIERERIAG